MSDGAGILDQVLRKAPQKMRVNNASTFCRGMKVSLYRTVADAATGNFLIQPTIRRVYPKSRVIEFEEPLPDSIRSGDVIVFEPTRTY